MKILRVEGLTKVFGSGELAVTAPEDISFSVQSGQMTALLGPSGSGKTTLLLCISLILEPTRGIIVINSQDIFRHGWTGIDLRRFRREHIGFVFQGQNLIPFLTARENIELPMYLTGASQRVRRPRAEELLQYLEIGHRSRALPALLSGGEQQRVAIGRALTNCPPLILADEFPRPNGTAGGVAPGTRPAAALARRTDVPRLLGLPDDTEAVHLFRGVRGVDRMTA